MDGSLRRVAPEKVGRTLLQYMHQYISHKLRLVSKYFILDEWIHLTQREEVKGIIFPLS